MEELRRNEFKDLLEMNELLFQEKEYSIVADIPKLGTVTYFPKPDKLQIHSNNKWEPGGFYLIKNHLKQLTQ